MKCGACGGSYTKISANLFGCATARNKGTTSYSDTHFETIAIMILNKKSTNAMMRLDLHGINVLLDPLVPSIGCCQGIIQR
jgi:hypothetical protein